MYLHFPQLFWGEMWSCIYIKNYRNTKPKLKPNETGLISKMVLLLH